ncbi:MAG TPA: alcohol dehydrogenase catalytic domain-containing protein [Candidatus Hydrogenedentes bacterium]|nr:alcohol dehydrogenase catalytic domain-containing protein [Candidatus Hydrogenedentota bacterium]MDY0031117.1 alcohol dehydrogenase catalytic domain-containing protein [FCB group bacterium]NLT61710.1 alcohol dehydrogenase catalytic domain-containing protein [Candidatus Hydrogenedentota bacterium]HNZ19163.1 alcohol dehydrogenase catalytic domain-containing protein [Candidatus Hydrogenedentota bacterium]HOH32365.1 alcohol dehydrogenase catalytic domain-containing protein [Candidatus Hydrogened
MNALVFDGAPRIATVPRPAPRPGEALIRVRCAGICNTDIEIMRGYMGFSGIPGHEFVGVVEEASNSHLLGKRVVGEINCVCGACPYCEMEMPNHCSRRTVLGIQGRDGAFAEYLVLPEENLHLVPDELPDEAAVFTEPAAAAFRILEQVEIDAADRIIVLGDGKLGLLVAQVLWLQAKNLVCVGKHPWKLAVLEPLRIKTALAGEFIEPGAEVVVEATGSAAGLKRALHLVRPEGVVVLKTTVAGASQMDLSLPVINEVQIVGSRCGPFRPALEALALGTLVVRPMITATYPLEEADRAFEHAQSGDAIKIVLRMSE